MGPLVAQLVEEPFQLPVVEVENHDFRFFRFPFAAWAFEIFAALVFVIPSRRRASYTFGFLIERYFLPGTPTPPPLPREIRRMRNAVL